MCFSCLWACYSLEKIIWFVLSLLNTYKIPAQNTHWISVIGCNVDDHIRCWKRLKMLESTSHCANDSLKNCKSLMQCKLQIHHDIYGIDKDRSKMNGQPTNRASVWSFAADKYPGVFYGAGIFNLRLLLCMRGGNGLCWVIRWVFRGFKYFIYTACKKGDFGCTVLFGKLK